MGRCSGIRTAAHISALLVAGFTVAATMAGVVSPVRALAQESPRFAQPAVLVHRAGTNPLQAFHAALRNSAAGKSKTRILFFGDSHTAADFMTGRLRERLQARFGDAGPGFVVAGKPRRFYRHDRLDSANSNGFVVSKAPSRPTSTPTLPLGLSGLELDSAGQHALATLNLSVRDIKPEAPLNFELLYLRRPGGGLVEVRDETRTIASVNTVDTSFGAGYFPFSASARQLTFEVQSGAPVGLYGLVIESARPGVVLDSLGIPGARARAMLAWDTQVFESQVRHRAPQLVVLSYGTNEATDKEEDIAVFQRQFAQVVQRVRQLAPEASCLVLGPTDHVERVDRRNFRATERTALIIPRQRKIALEAGCGFIDLVQVGGGPMSTLRASRMSPARAARDLIHFTRLGYEELADSLFEALVRGL